MTGVVRSRRCTRAPIDPAHAGAGTSYVGGVNNTELEAAYLGGHPLYAANSPASGRLVLTESAVRFETAGEYGHEPLFSVAWEDVAYWLVEGSNTAAERSSAGRVVAGALLAGAAGALLGSLAKRAEFQAVLIIESGGDRIGFAVKDMPPVALEAALRHYPAAITRSGRSTPGAGGPAPSVAWSYRVCGIDELDAAGAEGWEAVGVWVESSAPRVLLKRPA